MRDLHTRCVPCPRARMCWLWLTSEDGYLDETLASKHLSKLTGLRRPRHVRLLLVLPVTLRDSVQIPPGEDLRAMRNVKDQVTGKTFPVIQLSILEDSWRNLQLSGTQNIVGWEEAFSVS